jgi:hypothetical protein
LDRTDEWCLSLDSDDTGQILTFTYPSTITRGLSPYFPASVRIEFGARADHFPHEHAEVTPYVCEAISDAMSQRRTAVRVLAAARTFWEKATILHMLHHQPTGKPVRPRMSRHYYDMYQLARSDARQKAMDSIGLLERVAINKHVSFRAAWAHYKTAKPGTIALLPAAHIVESLHRDYRDMRPMFFEEPPAFQTILDELAVVETQINGRA